MKKRQYIETTNTAAFLLTVAFLLGLAVIGTVLSKTTDTSTMQFITQILGILIGGIGIGGAFYLWAVYPQYFKERHEVKTDG